MYETMDEYLDTVNYLLRTKDGTNLARLISLSDPHAKYAHLQVEFPETLVKSMVTAPFDDMFIGHIKVLFYLSRSREWIFFVSSA